MFKKTMTYKDYNGEDVTRTFYFNISRAELIELEASSDGGVFTLIDQLTENRDIHRIVEIFKTFILKSIGRKSPDGERFIKSEEIAQEFSQTEAFSDLFVELASDSDFAAEFVKGILPNEKQMRSVIDKLSKNNA